MNQGWNLPHLPPSSAFPPEYNRQKSSFSSACRKKSRWFTKKRFSSFTVLEAGKAGSTMFTSGEVGSMMLTSGKAGGMMLTSGEAGSLIIGWIITRHRLPCGNTKQAASSGLSPCLYNAFSVNMGPHLRPQLIGLTFQSNHPTKYIFTVELNCQPPAVRGHIQTLASNLHLTLKQSSFKYFTEQTYTK